MVELVDTLVLEASTSVCEFESRLGHQIRKCGRVRFIATVLKTVEQKCSVSSNLVRSAILKHIRQHRLGPNSKIA